MNSFAGFVNLSDAFTFREKFFKFSDQPPERNLVRRYRNFALNTFQTGGRHQFIPDILPIHIAVAGKIVLVPLAGVIMQVAGNDFRKHFINDVVIPLRRIGCGVLPRSIGGAFGVKFPFAHNIGVARIVAEAESIGGELFFPRQQPFRGGGLRPDVFDTDGHTQFFGKGNLI